MFIRLVCLTLFVYCCFATNDTRICQQLINTAKILCMESNHGISSIPGPPGKRGQSGSPGTTGSPGSVGPSGVVDYDRVNSEITRQIQRVIVKNEAEKREFLQTIANLKVKVQLLEDREGVCEIKYGNKCFWLVALDQTLTTYYGGLRLCALRGGSPANIYTREHYDIIMRYLRARMLYDRDNVFAWIGMRTNPSTGAVSLSDGTPARFMKWYPGGLRTDVRKTHMTIVQRNPSTASNIGIHNLSPSDIRNAVLCEL